MTDEFGLPTPTRTPPTQTIMRSGTYSSKPRAGYLGGVRRRRSRLSTGLAEDQSADADHRGGDDQPTVIRSEEIRDGIPAPSSR